MSHVTQGWTSTYATIKQAASFPETAKFAVAYFFYSDSYSTIGQAPPQPFFFLSFVCLFICSTQIFTQQ